MPVDTQLDESEKSKGLETQEQSGKNKQEIEASGNDVKESSVVEHDINIKEKNNVVEENPTKVEPGKPRNVAKVAAVESDWIPQDEHQNETDWNKNLEQGKPDLKIIPASPTRGSQSKEQEQKQPNRNTKEINEQRSDLPEPHQQRTPSPVTDPLNQISPQRSPDSKDFQPTRRNCASPAYQKIYDREQKHAKRHKENEVTRESNTKPLEFQHSRKRSRDRYGFPNEHGRSMEQEQKRKVSMRYKNTDDDRPRSPPPDTFQYRKVELITAEEGHTGRVKGRSADVYHHRDDGSRMQVDHKQQWHEKDQVYHKSLSALDQRDLRGDRDRSRDPRKHQDERGHRDQHLLASPSDRLEERQHQKFEKHRMHDTSRQSEADVVDSAKSSTKKKKNKKNKKDKKKKKDKKHKRKKDKKHKKHGHKLSSGYNSDQSIQSQGWTSPGVLSDDGDRWQMGESKGSPKKMTYYIYEAESPRKSKRRTKKS